MADFPNIEPDSEEIALIANNQVYNSPLTGQAQTASLTGAKWQCTPTFSNRNGKEARDLRAFLFNQEGVSGRFNYYPASVDNIGTHAGGGVVDGAGQTGKELVTKGWDADQPLLFSAGDYLTVNGEMKMVTADVAVAQDYIEYDETNYMPSPFDPSGWDNDDFKTSITNLTKNNPSGEGFSGLCEQVLDGGSADSITNGNTGASVAIGDKYYISVIAKSITNDNSFRLRFNDDTGFLGSVSINVDTGERFYGGGGYLNQTWLVTDLANGYKLFQTEVTAYRAGSYMDGQIMLEGKNTSVAPPPIGSQLYVQAAFFGKANDWPAKLRANATIPITPAIRVSPSDENAIEVENPYFPARLDTDDMSRLQVSAPVIYNTTLSIVEDF